MGWKTFKRKYMNVTGKISRHANSYESFFVLLLPYKNKIKIYGTDITIKDIKNFKKDFEKD